MRIDREEKTNFATPFIWQNDQRTELVTSGIGYHRSYDLEGNLLWQIKGKSILAIPTPFAQYGNLYLTAGHVLWGENPFYVVKPGASGDISPPDGTTSTDHIAWSSLKMGPYHPTPLIVDDVLYVLYDRGFLAAFDAKTGQEVYGASAFPTAAPSPARPGATAASCFASTKTASRSSSKPARSSRFCTPTRWPMTTWAWPRRSSWATSCWCARVPACTASVRR